MEAIGGGAQSPGRGLDVGVEEAGGGGAGVDCVELRRRGVGKEAGSGYSIIVFYISVYRYNIYIYFFSHVKNIELPPVAVSSGRTM